MRWFQAISCKTAPEGLPPSPAQLHTSAEPDLHRFSFPCSRHTIFEVESSASSSMANNAMKIFAQDVDDFVKPLFFFHVLLSGGADNERISSMRRQWGTHN